MGLQCRYVGKVVLQFMIYVLPANIGIQYNNNIIVTWDNCGEHIIVIYLVHTKE